MKKASAVNVRAVNANGLAMLRAGTAVVLTAPGEEPAAMLARAGDLSGGPAEVVVATTAAAQSGLLGPALLAALGPAPRTSLGRRLLADRERPVLLAVSHAGAVRERGPAWLAGKLGREVLATGGPVAFGPGTAFAEGDAPDAGWHLFRTGAEPLAVGRRYPAPSWEDDLHRSAELVQHAAADVDLRLTHVPSGLLLHARGRGGTALSSPAQALPMSRKRMNLIVGLPGQPPIDAMQLAAVIAAIPAPLQRVLRLVPWGPRPAGREQQVADKLDRGVDVDVVAVPGEGRRSFATSIAYLPHSVKPGPPVVTASVLPLAGLPVRGPHSVWLADGLAMTAVPAGLAVWCEPAPSEATDRVRALPADPDRVTVLVGVPGQAVPNGTWQHVSRVLQALGEDVRAEVSVRVMGDCDALSTQTATEVTGGCGVELRFDRPAPPPGYSASAARTAGGFMARGL